MKKAAYTRFANQFAVKPDSRCRLDKVDPSSKAGLKDKEQTEIAMQAVHTELNEIQEVLYAQGKHSLLVVIQAMDTGGKDGTIRHVFGPLNPQGVTVTSFKAPTAEELAHDYLWRIHSAVPPKGMIGIAGIAVSHTNSDNAFVHQRGYQNKLS